MIVTLDKNKKLRLTYDGRSYIIHNHDNHYYIMKDNDKIYCTKEVKEYYKKTKQSQQPKLQPITHTLQTFEMNGNKYAVEKLNKNYCVRRNGIYICTNEVKQVLKQIYGGVPVNISGPIKDHISIKISPEFRSEYEIRKNFINNLKILYDKKIVRAYIEIDKIDENIINDPDYDEDENEIVFREFGKLSKDLLKCSPSSRYCKEPGRKSTD